jgi:hypothetical protein
MIGMLRMSPSLLILLSGCDLLFPPCTNYKRKVCSCDDAGTAMCKAAEAGEKKAKEYKQDGDDDRYDKMQDACEVVLDAWKEADGCDQFADGGGGGGSSGDGGENGPSPSTVTGKYNVQIAAPVGCAGESYWLEEWVPGPMTISGEPSSLTFDFGDGIELYGAVESSFVFYAEGEADVAFSVDGNLADARLDIFNSGTFSDQDNGCFVMDGDIEAMVDVDGLSATNCIITASMVAYQLEGEVCDGL